MKKNFSCHFFFKDTTIKFPTIIETIIENYVKNILNNESNFLEVD